MKRTIAGILLITFSATVGCTTYYAPVTPQPKDDPSTCEDLVGKTIHLRQKGETGFYCRVLACDSLTISVRPTAALDRSTAESDTLTYELRNVSISTGATQVKWGVVALVGVGIVVLAIFLLAKADDAFDDGTFQ